MQAKPCCAVLSVALDKASGPMMFGELHCNIAGEGAAGGQRLRSDSRVAGSAAQRGRQGAREGGGRAAQSVVRPPVGAHDAALQRNRPARCTPKVRPVMLCKAIATVQTLPNVTSLRCTQCVMVRCMHANIVVIEYKFSICQPATSSLACND